MKTQRPKIGRYTFSLIALLVCMSVNEIVIMERDVLLAALLDCMIDFLKFLLIKEWKDTLRAPSCAFKA